MRNRPFRASIGCTQRLRTSGDTAADATGGARDSGAPECSTAAPLRLLEVVSATNSAYTASGANADSLAPAAVFAAGVGEASPLYLMSRTSKSGAKSRPVKTGSSAKSCGREDQ